MTHSGNVSSIDDLVAQDLTRVLKEVDVAELSHSHILASGCTGFVGYWLLMAIRELNQSGADIRVTATTRDPAGFLLRHPIFADLSWLRLLKTDVRYFEPAEVDYDFCIHAATETRPQQLKHEQTVLEAAIEGTHRFGVQAGLSSIRAMLVISSGAVYGRGTTPVKPGSLDLGYAQAKLLMEQLAAYDANHHGYRLTVARCFAFIGHQLPPHLAISQFIDAALFEEHIELTGDGSPVRSYLYAADMAVWLLAALVKGQHGVAYDVGSSQGKSLGAHARIVRDVLSPGKKVIIADESVANESSRQVYLPDISLSQQDLGVAIWTPEEDAIRRAGLMRSSERLFYANH